MSIEERIKDLPWESQERIKTAYNYLMSSNTSSFADFEKERNNNTGSQMLPFAFILRPTLECALFPDLFPFISWCDTCVQMGKNYSVKEGVSEKKFSALLDYTEDHRLHQYHLDRWQWSTVTAAFNASVSKNTTLSFTLSEKWLSPEYMFNVAAGVTDIV